MTEILVNEDVSVKDFAHGIPAIEFMKETGVPHVLIIDLKIPDLDPMELKSHLTSLPGSEKVSIIVASGNSKIEEWAQKLDATTFIKKPYDVENYILTVLSVLDTK